MSDSDNVRSEKRREIMVVVLAPAVIIALTLASWVLARWHIGPVFLNASLALAAVLIGGTPRFIAGFKDICRCRITVNVFVLVALAATVAIRVQVGSGHRHHHVGGRISGELHPG